jgi:hypothetical protein
MGKEMNAKDFLIAGLVSTAIGIVFIIAVNGFFATAYQPRVLSYQTDYFEVYPEFSDIYIENMQRDGNTATIYFYPGGQTFFSFESDGTLRNEIGDRFIECTMSGNYIIITDTNIPFMPETDPSVWGNPVGDDDDFSAMKRLFKINRAGDCSEQTDFIMNLAEGTGIITRRINLWQSPQNGVLTAEGHTTMEIYDRKTKRWMWMDPAYNIVGGRVGNIPITLHDLRFAVNQGAEITLITTDGAEIRFASWEYAKKWRNYLNPSQVVSYTIPGNQ